MLSKIKNFIIPMVCAVPTEIPIEEVGIVEPLIEAATEESSKISIMESLSTIAKFFDYLMHPTKVLLLIWNWTFSMSYMICLLLAMFSMLMIIIGYPKFKYHLGGSIIGYLFMNIINALIKGII